MRALRTRPALAQQPPLSCSGHTAIRGSGRCLRVGAWLIFSWQSAAGSHPPRARGPFRAPGGQSRHPWAPPLTPRRTPPTLPAVFPEMTSALSPEGTANAIWLPTPRDSVCHATFRPSPLVTTRGCLQTSPPGPEAPTATLHQHLCQGSRGSSPPRPCHRVPASTGARAPPAPPATTRGPLGGGRPPSAGVTGGRWAQTAPRGGHPPPGPTRARPVARRLALAPPAPSPPARRAAPPVPAAAPRARGSHL